MNRVTAAAVTAATATVAAAVTIVPALAAPRPAAAHLAAHVATAHVATAHHGTAKAQAAARHAGTAGFSPTAIASELDGGAYVTVVRCQGVDAPPPVRLGRPGTPLTVSGVGPSAAIFAMLKRPNPYKTIYTCTVVVKHKAPAKPKPTTAKGAHPTGCEIAAGAGPSGAKCTRKVTLNTGFGGLAGQVRDHHPAG